MSEQMCCPVCNGCFVPRMFERHHVDYDGAYWRALSKPRGGRTEYVCRACNLWAETFRDFLSSSTQQQLSLEFDLATLRVPHESVEELRKFFFEAVKIAVLHRDIIAGGKRSLEQLVRNGYVSSWVTERIIELRMQHDEVMAKFADLSSRVSSKRGIRRLLRGAIAYRDRKPEYPGRMKKIIVKCPDAVREKTSLAWEQTLAAAQYLRQQGIR